MSKIKTYFQGSDKLHRIYFGAKSFKDYIEVVENFFHHGSFEAQEEFKQTKAELTKKYYDYEPEEINRIEGQLLDKMYEMDVEFRHRFRSSLIIQLYMFLETELKFIAVQHSKRLKTTLNLKDIKGKNDIQKIQKFLKENANVDISSDNKLWIFISDFRKLRNKIVHHKSKILLDDNDFDSIRRLSVDNFDLLQSYLEPNEYQISLNSSDFLYLSVNIIQSFLEKISIKNS